MLAIEITEVIQVFGVYLECLLQGSDIVVVCSNELNTCYAKCPGSRRLCGTGDSPDIPAFFEHSSGNRAAHAAGGTTDGDQSRHCDDRKLVKRCFVGIQS